MNYPDYNTYTKLYMRYLRKGPEKFFTRCDPKGKRVLDSCAGGGQLSKYALDQGAEFVCQVDICRKMLDPNFSGDERTMRLDADVWDYLMYFNGTPYDIVVCRQAVTYWMKRVSGDAIALVIKPKGMFVFNTFGNKPSETPTIIEYYHEGIAYKEIRYAVGDLIHHVQTASGMEPHMTTFHWIDREEYIKKLEPYFDLTEEINGPSSMWYCRRI